MPHRSLDELLARVDEVRDSPSDQGLIALIARRPAVGARDVVGGATLDEAVGVVGDTWKQRGSSRTADGTADPEKQVTLMNSRAADLVAGSVDRWPLAGDQFYVDFDLSVANVPPGTRLGLGSAVLEVTAEPHRGCAKFSARFGADAVRFVNSDVGKELNLRGVNARVVEPGTVRVGDLVRKLD